MPKPSKYFTTEIEDYIGKHWSCYMDRELGEVVYKKFGVSISADNIKGLRYRRGWLSENAGAKGKRTGKSEFLFPYAAKGMIAWLCTTMTDTELINLINEKFHIERTAEQLKRWRKCNGIKTGRLGFFQKGHPAGPGAIKKGEHRSPGTEFKKGNDNGMAMPVGTEVFSEGYWKRKIAAPNKWMLRARWVWEQSNPPIKPGEVIIHIDGDTNNDSLENLRLINHKVLGRINTNGRYHNRKVEKGQVDWNRSCILIAEIEQKIVEGMNGN